MKNHDKLYEFFGVEKLTSKTITVDDRQFIIRIPSVGELTALAEEKDRSKLNNFALKLIDGFPEELTWEDVLEMPSTGATAITNVITAVLNTITPESKEVRGN